MTRDTAFWDKMLDEADALPELQTISAEPFDNATLAAYHVAIDKLCTRHGVTEEEYVQELARRLMEEV